MDTIERCTWLAGPGVLQPHAQTVAEIVATGIAVCTANSNDWRPLAQKYGAQQAREIIGRVRWMADCGVRLITGMAPFDAFPAALQNLEEWGFTRDQKQPPPPPPTPWAQHDKRAPFGSATAPTCS